MDAFRDYREHVPSPQEGVGKATLFRGEKLMLGLNALPAGAEQRVHTHVGQDKFYHVLEGAGRFTVGGDEQLAGPGTVVWAPAGVPHGVRNPGQAPLVLLVGFAPPP
jgi:quercetin dioxygenase-like cupin family protein